MKEYESVPLPEDPAEETGAVKPEAAMAESLPEAGDTEREPEDNNAGGGTPADAERENGEAPEEEAAVSAPENPPETEKPEPARETPAAAGVSGPAFPAADGRYSVPAVSCYGLSKYYGATPALSELSIELPAGKIVGLLGPNGSGKTTLIKVLAGLLTPTSGEALVYGEKPGPKTKAFVSYLPERTYFDPGMKVRECIRLFRDFYRDFDEMRAESLLAALGVPTDRKLKTLSKGTKEKVQLVLVMSRRARLYLLDEPIGGVDPAARELILSTIVTHHDPEATVLISTHLIRDVEPVLDGFVFLGGGTCVMSGDAETVRRESGKTLDELFREVFRCL